MEPIVYTLAEKSLKRFEGETIQSVVRVGKHIYLTFESGATLHIATSDIIYHAELEVESQLEYIKSLIS